jgi:predicted RNA-binding protein YlxR (DUF448 family)
VQGKRALLRLVRTEQGVEIDPTGKKAGRGAYLHPYQSCWQAALRGNRIEQALRTRLSEQDRQMLQRYMATLPESIDDDEEGAEDKAPTVPKEPASRGVDVR